MEALELSFGGKQLLNKCDLVKCLETDEIGTVIDVLHFRDGSMVMVRWPKETSWVESIDLVKLDTF